MDYLEPMTAAVRAAANIYRSAKNDLHIEVKGEDKNNLVTAYDKQIQDFLYKELSAAFPGCAFLGEEGGGKIEVPMGLCFIIDPIDGTTNFIRNFEHSAIRQRQPVRRAARLRRYFKRPCHSCEPQ